jgi:hypothetical protein
MSTNFDWPPAPPGYYQPPPPPPPKSHKARNIVLGIVGGFTALIVVSAVASTAGGSGSASQPVSAPVAAAPVTAPAPAAAAPAPVAKAAPKPAPAPKVLTFTGHGNASTPKFITTGDFTVSWVYSGNVDNSFGSSMPDNFAADMYTSGLGQDVMNFNGVNEIQSSGSGNQTISGDDGTHYFTVQSNGASTWTFKVKTG